MEFAFRSVNASMRDPVRTRAIQLLLQVEEGIPLSGPMEQAETQLEAVARPRLRSLVSSTLRNRSRIDAVLQTFLRKTKVRKLHPPLRQILRLGAGELIFEDKPDAVVVDAWVGEAGRFGHQGTRGLCNAVLRRVAESGAVSWHEVVERRDGLEKLALEFSHPTWLVERWTSQFGEERCREILAWNQQPPEIWLRLQEDLSELESSSDPGVGTQWPALPAQERPALPAHVHAALPGQPTWIPGTLRLEPGTRATELPGFKDGDFTIQDGSGTLVGLLPPEVHGTVVDLCSAPGTKTGHLLERATPGSRIVAADLSVGRLRRLGVGLSRLSAGDGAAVGAGSGAGSGSGAGGGTGAEVGTRAAAGVGTGARASSAGSESGKGVALHRVAADGAHPAWAPAIDGILVDAPCSNLGVIRRRPDVRWRAREDEIGRLAEVQRGLLQAATATVAPGGWLVYSVCTIEPQETWNHREWFLETQPGWSPVPVPAWVPDSVRRDEGETFLVPGEHGTDGGYAFVMRRDSR